MPVSDVLRVQGPHVATISKVLPEAYVFETGTNEWRTFDRWPPPGVRSRSLYLREDGKLAFDVSKGGGENPSPRDKES